MGHVSQGLSRQFIILYFYLYLAGYHLAWELPRKRSLGRFLSEISRWRGKWSELRLYQVNPPEAGGQEPLSWRRRTMRPKW
jgi:hypothetical protein